MSDVIISVSNLGKRYRIKHQAEGQRYPALRDVIAEKFKGLFQNRKSEIGNRKLKGSAGVSPASFGVSPKETIKPPGGTPAEGNRASGSETTARRDGRAPQTSPLRPDRGEGQGEVFDASSNRKSEIGNRPRISGRSRTFPSRLNVEKWWGLLAGTEPARAHC